MNTKLQDIEIQNAVQLESEKVAVGEIVDASAAGWPLALNGGQIRFVSVLHINLHQIAR